MLKQKNRNEKLEPTLKEQIDKATENMINLSEHKIELINELNYLCEYHNKKLYEIIR